MKRYYYAVNRGSNGPAIYNSWDECKSNVSGYSGAIYKKFTSAEEAAKFAYGQSARTLFTHTPPSSSSSTTYVAQYRIGFGRSAPLSTEPLPSSYPSSSTFAFAEPPPVPKSPFQTKAPSKSLKRSLQASSDGDDYLDDGPRQTHISPSGLLIREEFSPMQMPRKKPPPTESIVVYTDGACPANGRAGAVGGVGVFFGPNDPRNISEGLPGEIQTNQRAELLAAVRAIEAVQQTHSNPQKVLVEVRTDSKYIVNGMTSWINNWKAGNWISGGRAIANRDLWERLDSLRDAVGKVEFKHVPGHSGVVGNEEADRLAVRGAAKNSKFTSKQKDT